MTPELATQWAAALRSGRYVQGKGAMHRKGRHCVLGVLQDLLGAPYPTVLHSGLGYIWSRRNDAGTTFAEFADDIERLWVKP